MRGRILGTALALALIATGAWASGVIDGKVTNDRDDQGVGGVTVVVSETAQVALTTSDGTFRIDNVAPGSYNLTFNVGEHADSEAGVAVEDGATTHVDKHVDWDVSFAETITIFSASRRRERIVEAPAAVTVIDEAQIERESSAGQLPKVLEFTPGVEVTQSGVNDFNLNTRGFNSSLTRRVQVLLDGRDPAVPFLGSTEWGYLAEQEGLASMELIRGPSSALYGANAFNGVLNLTTKAPKDSVGGRLTLTGGELSTLRGELGWATSLGSDWFVRLIAAYSEGEGFTRDRRAGTEYPGLPRENAWLPNTNEFDSQRVELRVDKELAGGSLLSLESGYFDAEGYVVVTGIGRVDVNDVERTFTRFNFSHPRFNVLAYTNSRESPDQLALASAGRIFLDTENRNIEVQGNVDFGNRGRLVVGASYKETEIDTANDDGRQTLVFRPVDSDSQALFAQADFELGDNVKLVLAGRYDESSLHESRFSPKAALVWSLSAHHTLRFSYNEAFQKANYSEYFLDAPTAIPGNPPIPFIDLGGIEAALCAPFGVSCGFDQPTGVRALGNEDLELEEVTSWEVGYSGILGNKAFLTIDYYNSELKNFITDLTGNPFGLINPSFGPYQPPANHPAPDLLLGTLAGALGGAFFFLSNNVDGTPIFALASYTNAGAVDTQGVDVGLNVYATPQLAVEFSYSWFDFDIVEGGVGGEELTANAPENKYSFGLAYRGSSWSGAVRYRWVDDFEWSAGTSFKGPVLSYEVVNLSGDYAFSDRIKIGFNVSNLFDDEHYESFGGDLVGRRALAHVGFRW